MKQAVEKTTGRAGKNHPAENEGLFSRLEMESLVKGLAGPSWGKWIGDGPSDALPVDQKLSALSDQQLEKVLTQMLEQMVEEGWKRG